MSSGIQTEIQSETQTETQTEIQTEIQLERQARATLTPAEKVSVGSQAKTESQLAGLDQLLGHPNLWRGTHLESPGQACPALTTGFSTLNDHLPGNGWPQAGLMEMLLPSSGIGELRLLAPALKVLSQTENRWVAWVNPPFIPYAPALQAIGIDINKILLIHPARGASTSTNSGTDNGTENKQWQNNLWSLERAAKSGSCSALLAWVDEKRLTLRDTQRLQNAAKQGRTLICLMRPLSAAQHASMAELRLSLRPAQDAGQVQLDIVKRRGGWPIQNLQLDLATTTRTRHRTPRDIHEQLTLWRAGAMPSLQPAVRHTGLESGLESGFESEVEFPSGLSQDTSRETGDATVPAVH